MGEELNFLLVPGDLPFTSDIAAERFLLSIPPKSGGLLPFRVALIESSKPLMWSGEFGLDPGAEEKGSG